MSSILSFFTQTIGPLSLGQWLAVLALLAVVAYVVYDKFFKDDKKKDGHDHQHQEEQGKGKEQERSQEPELEKEKLNGILTKLESGNLNEEEIGSLKKAMEDGSAKLDDKQLGQFNAIQAKNQEKSIIDSLLNKFKSGKLESKEEYDKMIEMKNNNKFSTAQLEFYDKVEKRQQDEMRQRQQAQQDEIDRQKKAEDAIKQKAKDAADAAEKQRIADTIKQQGGQQGQPQPAPVTGGNQQVEEIKKIDARLDKIAQDFLSQKTILNEYSKKLEINSEQQNKLLSLDTIIAENAKLKQEKEALEQKLTETEIQKNQQNQSTQNTTIQKDNYLKKEKEEPKKNETMNLEDRRRKTPKEVQE